MKDNKSVSVMIGNSDNKLSQAAWANFVADVRAVCAEYACQLHFDGGARSDSAWQNWCFVFVVEVEKVRPLVVRLERYRVKYGQNSIVWALGVVMFIEKAGVTHRGNVVNPATGLPFGHVSPDAARLALQGFIDDMANLGAVDNPSMPGTASVVLLDSQLVQLQKLASPRCKNCGLHHVGASV